MKIVLYTNILTPYRKHFYDLFYEECKSNGDEFYLWIMAETENNRNWHYRDFKAEYATLLPGKTISHGETYIHINTSLQRIIKEIDPDIVIASGSYLCPGVWQIAKWKDRYNYKALFWNESHLGESRDFNSLKYKIRETMRKVFYKKFDGFLYPGKLAKQLVETYANTKAYYIQLPNLIDEKLYALDKKNLDRDNEKTVMFCPARLSPVKGIGEFMDILSASKYKEKAKIYVAGDGELKQTLIDKATQLGLDVHFVGPKSQMEVIDFYKKANIFLLPSLSDPNPLSCIEASWARLPLLVSNHVGNYPEIIMQGKNGYVFSYQDKEEAVHIIDEILCKNSEWLINASEMSRQNAEKIFDSRKTVSRVVEELRKMR